MQAEAPTINQARTPRPPAGRTVAAVIPAFNEAGRIGRVLLALQAAPEVSEIIVISDGSTDGTYEAARAFPSVQAVQLPCNKGKAGAMSEGARRTQADVLLFFDADLVGLKPEHVRDLVAPVCSGEADMATGIFKGGRWATDIAQLFSPGITGQRAIRRDVFLQIPNLESVGYGVELAITYYVRHNGYTARRVTLVNITHPMKEEKLGPLKGVLSRGQMYWQMLRFRISYELYGRPPRRLSAPRSPACPPSAAEDAAPQNSQSPV